jgi:hypothetical protein
LNFSVPSESDHYATVSITLSDGTVDSGELITLDGTLVHPAAGSSMSAADEAADEAFLAFMLSSAGRAALKADGYDLVSPVFSGATSADTAATLPSDVLSAFKAAGGTTSSG